MRLHFAAFCLVLACTPKPGTAFVPVGTPSSDAGVELDAGAVCLPTCATFKNPVGLGPIVAPVVELSGLAASRTQKNVLYGHNDSGDSAHFWALSAVSGAVLQEFHVKDASNKDWEDVAVGPCPKGGPCLFIGDVGDNLLTRSDYVLYAVPEPMVATGGALMNVPSESLPFEYPGRANHNSEAILVDPVSGRPYVITKELNGRPSEVYRFPLPLTPGTSATLELVATLPVPAPTDLQLTGADVSPCGDAVLLRMYNRLVIMRSFDGGLESAFDNAATNVPVAQEVQGEAVTFAADGRSYFTGSETITDPPLLYQSVCK